MEKWLTIARESLNTVLAAGAIIYTAHRAIVYIYKSSQFLEELARNHLPHIYARLEAIERKLGLSSPDSPPPQI